MRELGLDPANGGTTRTIRRRAAVLGLDTSHFRGNRSWSDAVLRQAVSESRTGEEVLAALGLSARAGGERTLVKAHAVRLGLDVSHLGHSALHAGNSCELEPRLTHLRRAAESLAAAWFVLCGRNVLFPVEPDAYDLLADLPDGMKRVQVKTTAFKSKDGWLAQIGRRPYSAGNNARTYTQFIIASAGGLMASRPPAAPPPRGCVIPAGRESYDVPGMVPGPRSL